MEVKINMKELGQYLTDEETGLDWYAGQLSPISLSDDPNHTFAAPQSSRYLTSENRYRAHSGRDSASPRGTPAKSTINGVVKYTSDGNNLEIYTNDGKY
ncbi:MAG TPA: hypothetical protein V6C96_05195, partial [Vampirovibrionales bacterium]